MDLRKKLREIKTVKNRNGRKEKDRSPIIGEASKILSMNEEDTLRFIKRLYMHDHRFRTISNEQLLHILKLSRNKKFPDGAIAALRRVLHGSSHNVDWISVTSIPTGGQPKKY